MTETLELTDKDGDRLVALSVVGGNQPLHGIVVRSHDDSEVLSVHLSREQALELYHHLGDWIMATAPCDTADQPDAEADGYAWPAEAESIALEAHRAVYGDRQTDYGHPREDFTRAAIIWTGLLQHKLADGQYVEADDIGRCMIGTKLARDVHAPKRDNRVDIAGYALTLDRLQTGQ